MILPNINISINEDKDMGWIRIKVVVERKNGQSEISTTIKDYSIGRKVEATSEKIEEILKEIYNDL